MVGMAGADTIEEELRKALRTRDLSFEEFMRLALYSDAGGYYRRDFDPVGQRGDYITSPRLSPVFAFAVARLVREFVRRCADEVCSVVDIGCGDGSLINAVWRELREVRRGVAFFGVDQSIARVPQSSRAGGVSYVTSLGEVPRSSPVLILSNELFDALPFGRLVQRSEALHELCVTRDESGALTWSERPADQRYLDYFRRRGIVLEPGQFADVSLSWELLYKDVVASFASAMVVTFDYGHEEKALFRGRARRYGTAVAYSGHQATRDLLANPGKQDLTAHINFTDLRRAGEEAGYETLLFESQAMFLLRLGAVAHPLLAPIEEGTTVDPQQAMAVIEARESAKRLILPDGPGLDVRVLVQARGMGADGWSFLRIFP